MENVVHLCHVETSTDPVIFRVGVRLHRPCSKFKRWRLNTSLHFLFAIFATKSPNEILLKNKATLDGNGPLPLAIIQFFPGTTIVSTHNLGYLGVSEKTGVVARSNFLL